MSYKRKKRALIDWFPKLSVITFVFSLFAFLFPDILKFIDNAPLLFNFFFGVVVLSALVILWDRNKLAGITFVILGLLYGLITWDRLLAVNTFSTSLWLIFTGLMFLVSEENSLPARKLATKKVDKN